MRQTDQKVQMTAGVVLRDDISLTPGAYDPTRLGDHDAAEPSLSGSGVE
jgi:hypothetical protein